MCPGGDLLQHGAQRGGQAAEPAELCPVGVEFDPIGQALVDEQVGDFLVGCLRGDFGDVVAAVMQVIAGVTDGADGGVAGDDAGECDGFLDLGRGNRVGPGAYFLSGEAGFYS